MSRQTLVFFVLLLLPAPVLAQAPDSLASGRAVLIVTTVPDSAWVYCDSVLAGRSPLRIDTLAPGRHVLRLLHRDFTNWLTEAVVDTFLLAAGETKQVHHEIPQWYSIISIPSGAEVRTGETLLGVTPLTLQPRLQAGLRSVTVRKPGYGEVTSNLGLASRGVLLIPLTPSGEAAESNDWRLANSQGIRTNTLPLWVAGGSAVLFGSFAAYFKIRADHRQADYLSTGNPYYLAERARMDDLSALYFIAAQIGLGVFIAFLVSD